MAKTTLNRKRRNLQYIRTKNKLRAGGTLVEFFKTSDGFKPTAIVHDQALWDVHNRGNELSKKFKMSLNCTYTLAYMNDDFVNETITIKAEFKKIDSYE